MEYLIFIPPRDFRDETLKYSKLFLDKWGVRFKVSSYTNKGCSGLHGDTVKPDVNTNLIDVNDYDGILLIDGKGVDDYKLPDFRPLLDTVTLFNNQNKKIIAFGNAISIVARANIIRDKRISVPTDYPDVVRYVKLFHGIPHASDLEMSGNIITMSDPKKINDLFDKVLTYVGVE